MDFEKSTRQSLASNKPVKPRKFRSSCDACSTSKVKCGQEQPCCTRCVNLGLTCNYSPSRRMGKPPASARQSSKPTSVSSDTERQSIPNPAKKRQLSPPSAIDLPASSKDGTQYMFDQPLMATPDLMSMNWDDDIFTNQAFDNAADIQLTPSNLYDFSFNFSGDTTQLGSQMVFGVETSLDSNNASIQDPIYDILQALSSNTSQSATKVSPRSSLTVPGLCTHPGVNRTPPPTPFLEPVHSIDQVLITNKTEIENAYSLLECDCSRNPHFALTLALICSRILVMYEIVIHSDPLSSNNSSSYGNVGITVGAYKISAEDEERMRLQIVVNEVRKVRGLVDKYASKYCSGDGSVGDIYTALVNYLKAKFATTLQDLLKRLES